MGIKIIDKIEASDNLQSLSDEFAIIQNPAFVHPEFEIVPLAKKVVKPKSMIATVMDMDGTTTTTEELCIESLEFMVRRMSGLLTNSQWSGFTQEDYPYVIGNSTTKHIEYLIRKYSHFINHHATIKSFIQSILWTLKKGKSEQRKKEVQELLKSFDLSSEFLNQFSNSSDFNSINLSDEILNIISQKIDLHDPSNLVKIGIEIYYQHYHNYLLSVSENSSNVNQKKLIEPLPGVSLFLSLIKGFLSHEAENLSEFLIEEFKRKNPETKCDFNLNEVKTTLKNVGLIFEKFPLKVAIVTSSIFYEADIVLKEVFNQLKDEVKNWQISEFRKELILKNFDSYEKYYDAIVTATDAYEFRLKPYRDLYSIALYRLGISKSDFDKVIGFEDSESGIIALRAAGVGCAIALPFPQTKNHNLEAATHVLWNGLPEFILNLSSNNEW
ncbi:MAG: hypothetical protein N3F03_07255 [Ignavibacteria bacterium]|nr:hypothetical protein [Ignavibacteria bacterium]